MDLDHILSLLRQNTAALRRHGVNGLAVFGPAARRESKPGSPVDFLLQLDPPHTFDQLFAVKRFLADLLGRPVELVVASPRHPLVREYAGEDVVVVMGE